MRYVVGGLLVVFGIALAVSRAVLADRVGASNNAFCRSNTFTGRGWTRWNRFIMVLVGSFFALCGALLATGVVEMRQ
ncbi:MAG: hypothetical protein Q8R60_00680 [Mycobacteriales bacterium]|nr:hypothetical protein [Mycobacteriales bacterium]